MLAPHGNRMTREEYFPISKMLSTRVFKDFVELTEFDISKKIKSFTNGLDAFEFYYKQKEV